MTVFLNFAFVFCIGSLSGWILEVFFRRFFSAANPERKWINPGFCTGPCLPLYGSGLCLLYLLAQMERLQWISDPIGNKVVTLLTMALSMTAIEYIAGFYSLKVSKVRLWDYSGEWGNIQGIICPKFSLMWAILGALYDFLLHPYILRMLSWFAEHMAFSFALGIFCGVFLVDVANSAQLVSKLRRYAEENNVVVRYEAIKTDIRKMHERAKKRYHFFRPFQTPLPLSEHLKTLKDSFEKIKRNDGTQK